MKDRPKPQCICVVGELLLEFLPTATQVQFSTYGDMAKSPSGAAGIFASAAAALGGQPAFIGKVGADPFSQFVLDAVGAYGVDTSHVKVDPERQLGLSFVEEVAGRRRFVYYRKDSAGSTLSAEDIDPSFVRKAGALYFPAMLLGLSPAMRSACLSAQKTAKEAGVLTAMDVNMRPELWQKQDDVLRAAVSQVDVLTMNEGESLQLTGASTVEAALSVALRMGPSTVAITRGAAGALLGSSHGTAEIQGVVGNAVDTVGAGDVFAAGLLVALLEGQSMADAGQFANMAAALKVMRFGGIGRGLPFRAEVLAALDAQNSR